MKILNETIKLKTGGFPDIIDLSNFIDSFLKNQNVNSGLLTVFVPGSTAGITTIEYEPGLLKDLPALSEKLAPRGVPFEHAKTWLVGNGFSFVFFALLKPSLSFLFDNGKP
ncbi:YjbQ family protein, partial [bacterium]|nr:YjbQ family protein [bacterium]